MDVMIVTGLSGAGRTLAANCLEDQGYYCIDNMPPVLIRNFVELCEKGSTPMEKACFVMDARGREFFKDFRASLESLKEDGIPFRILFLEASDACIVRRYGETRRDHPMQGSGTLESAIRKDREVMADIRSMANIVLDTTSMKQADLNNAIKKILNPDADQENLAITVESFGYKHGVPIDADFVFDMRFLPNPFYVPGLREKNGNDPEVYSYVTKAPEAELFLEEMESMLMNLETAYIREGKYHLVLAFGCTGGQHRSVAMANAFAERLEKKGYRVIRIHRDL